MLAGTSSFMPFDTGPAVGAALAIATICEIVPLPPSSSVAVNSTRYLPSLSGVNLNVGPVPDAKGDVEPSLNTFQPNVRGSLLPAGSVEPPTINSCTPSVP